MLPSSKQVRTPAFLVGNAGSIPAGSVIGGYANWMKLDASTVAKFATVQNEGGRDITREIEYYNDHFKITNNRGIFLHTAYKLVWKKIPFLWIHGQIPGFRLQVFSAHLNIRKVIYR